MPYTNTNTNKSELVLNNYVFGTGSGIVTYVRLEVLSRHACEIVNKTNVISNAFGEIAVTYSTVLMY